MSNPRAVIGNARGERMNTRGIFSHFVILLVAGLLLAGGRLPRQAQPLGAESLKRTAADMI
jgi:hypothetical protein